MRALDTRKTVSSLKRLCKDCGIEVSMVSGKGSHKALIFYNPSTGETVSVVIAGHGEITPGVQRGIKRYIGEIAEHVAVAEIVKEILDKLFN